jgi:hypothetical protein
VYNRTYQEHLHHLEQVFSILQQEQCTIKLSKCAFARRHISYVGYLISEAGVAICPDKVKVVVEWPQLTNIKELRSFLGVSRLLYEIYQAFWNYCQASN